MSPNFPRVFLVIAVSDREIGIHALTEPRANTLDDDDTRVQAISAPTAATASQDPKTDQIS
jgi:hypothetical protein